MPTFQSTWIEACQHKHRHQVATETIKNTTTGETKTTTFHQCEDCGHIEGRTNKPKPSS